MNLPYSLALVVGKRYHDTSADETCELHVGSEIEPIPFAHSRLRNGQWVDYWLVVQFEIPLIVAHVNGPPKGIEQGWSYRQRLTVLRPKCRCCLN